MKVKSIVIDGFKSYAHRQELSNLDPHFNAITGLNGSGKSNVFDAICFVMGLRNVAKVRVERQEEMIFKNGKAGIQRASVTIEFENNDPATAPQNYPPTDFPVISITRQIDTGLRQRFFFNGRLCDQDRIKEFFIQASLNIENPHFLVQQGQIHRLVGMKPAEILSYIEEAAGTLIFDHSRRKAELQMRSKEKRLHEINSSLDAEIGPRLRGIEEQDREYTKFVDVQENLEQLRRFAFALQFFQSEKNTREANGRLEAVNHRLEDLRASLRELQEQLSEKQNLVDRLEGERDGPKLEYERAQTEQQEVKKSIAQHKSRLTASQKQTTSFQDQLSKLEVDMKKANDNYEKFNENAETSLNRHAELRETVAATEKKIDDLKHSLRLQEAGIAAGSAGVSLEEEKAQLSKKRIQLEGRKKKEQYSLNQLEQEISDLTEQQKSVQRQQSGREKQLQEAKIQLERAEAAYRPLEEGQARFKTLQRTFDQHVSRLQEMSQRIATEVPIMAPLKYYPIPGWENMDSLIKGKVGELVSVKNLNNNNQNNINVSLALSVGAGPANLVRIVVETDSAAQTLIERGRLQQRSSFFSMNVMRAGTNPHCLDSRKIDFARRTAQEVSPQNAFAECALDLISFDTQYAGVMERVFGTFVVCSTIEVARAIAFSGNNIKAVTLEGDVVEPSGLMSGGSRNQNADLLSEFARGANKIQQYNEQSAQVAKLRQEYNNLQHSSKEANRLQELFDNCKFKVEELESAFRGSDFGRLEQQLNQARDSRGKFHKFVHEQFAQEHQAIMNRLEEIGKTEKLDSASVLKELTGEMKREETKLKKLNVEVNSNEAVNNKQEQEKDKLRAKLEAIEQSIADKKSDFDTAKEEESKLTEELLKLEEKIGLVVAKVKEAKQKYEAMNEQYARLTKEVDSLAEEKNDVERAIQKATTDCSETERSAKEARDQFSSLEKQQQSKHPWFSIEVRQSLGDTNGPFYFNDVERTEETLKKHAEYEELCLSLSKKVNRRARAMLEQWSEEHKKLVDQRQVLTEDKTNICDSITEVEKRKWTALDDVVARVSEHFSALFHTCLDYATCRLAEQRCPETKRLLGLEVKVAFNGKEKASLTELSGGQRSLLALCLILSILRVHRAPVYILDEVDAALDPSHTQNLGLMLKKHFADAQFLLVSLKDGMFSSANVVYEVRNTQGFSEVSRKEIRRR